MGDQTALTDITSRLRLARDQVDAVIAGLTAGTLSAELLRGLATASRTLDGAGYRLIATSMHECLSGAANSDVTAEQLEALFITLG